MASDQWVAIGTILLALVAFVTLIAPWVLPRALRVIKRWRQQITIRRNVAVIVDYRKMRRTCFWQDVYKHNEEVRLWTRFHFVSVADQLNQQKNVSLTLFDRRKTDVIVINWDAINGDPVYGSDRALEFFEHYRPDMTEWLKSGGVIIVESQGASWGALQRPYDAISKCLPGGKVSIIGKLDMTGEDITIFKDSARHPVLSKITNEKLLLRRGALCETKKWFPTDPVTPSLREASRRPRKVYRGLFQTYTGWQPLILSKKHGKPIMIYRTIKGVRETGACILTTMFLASSEFDELIFNLVAKLPGETKKG